MNAEPEFCRVVTVYREIGRRGLIAGSSGNVSHRTPSGMVITPSGCSAETLEPDAVVPMTLAGEAAGTRAPSSEWAMHAAIYLAYPTAQCIVHTHADACTALACLDEGLPPFPAVLSSPPVAQVRLAPSYRRSPAASFEAALAWLCAHGTPAPGAHAICRMARSLLGIER